MITSEPFGSLRSSGVTVADASPGMRASAARTELISPSASRHSHTAVNLTASSFRRKRDKRESQPTESEGDAPSTLHGPRPCGSGGSATDPPKTRCTPGSQVGQSGYQRWRVTVVPLDTIVVVPATDQPDS